MNRNIPSHFTTDNNLIKLSNGVWSANSNSSFDYTDGQASEEILQSILLKSNDRSSDSLELENAIYDWISAYHFSSARANIYRFLDLSTIENGLELGCGCGAISRYLGEQGIELDAVEGNFNRAAITALRCEGLDTVNTIHANFNDLRLPDNYYDAVFLNGVLEYAGKFHSSVENEVEALNKILTQSLDVLRDSGIICIAIENRMGLKYWLGAPEDHFGKAHVGLYDYPDSKAIKTYDKREWDRILSQLPGKVHHRFLYPFPDYKMAEAVLSDRYLQENPFAYSHLYRVASKANGAPLSSSMHEFQLWEALQGRDYFEEYANSFFIILSKDNDRLSSLCPYDFQHYSGTGRKPQYRTITEKKHGSTSVEKIPVFTDSKKSSDTVQQVLDPAQYVEGPLLAGQWLHALMADGDQPFTICLQTYFHYLVDYCSDEKRRIHAFDLLPFNIIVANEKEWCAIDTEWYVNVNVTPEYIYCRALFWFANGNENILQKIAGSQNLLTIRDFIKYGCKAVGLLPDQHIDDFVEKEELLQKEISSQIRENPIQSMLLQPLKIETEAGQTSSFIVQLYWAGASQSWAEDRCLMASGKLGSDRQAITFSLPAAAGEQSVLRFDPADRAGFFRLHRIRISPQVKNSDTGEAWLLEGIDQIVENTTLVNIEYNKNGLGEVLVSTGDDPHLILQLPADVQKWLESSGVTFEAIIDWPKSSDYLIAMEGLGKTIVSQNAKLNRLEHIEAHSQEQAKRISAQAAQLKEANDRIRAKEVYIENVDREIETMRQTRVWRAAEFLRSKIYYRLLDGKVILQKSVSTIRTEGFAQFLRKAKRNLGTRPDAATLGLNRNDYEVWIELNRLTDYDVSEITDNIKEFVVTPCISIVVPVYDVDQIWLEKTIDSVRNQLYTNWELCLCDDLSPSSHIREVLNRYSKLDDRIKVMFKEKNEGIAVTSNAALSMATGDYVGLLDHDDELSIDALYENVKAINAHPGVGLIYSDEDKLDMQGRRCDPFFKPDFSPELLHSQNYICHFTVIKKSVLDEIQGFREGFDGSQDHDLILRATEKATKVHHIPKILYHWRKIPGSTAAVYDSKSYAWEAGRKAVEESVARLGRKGKVEFARFQGSYRVLHEISGNPLVSIVIPFKDKSGLLQKCIESILGKSTYVNFEIIGVSNNSNEEKTHSMMKNLASADERVHFLEYNVPFNFSDICNHGVDKAKGEYIVLLNNDTEVISEGWLEALLSHAQVEGVGAVGGKLIYPDERIQHAGIVIGMTGVAGHSHILFHKDDVGYYARTHVDHNVSALTGACLMVKKSLYQQVGGLDSTLFGVAYNDVDFCLKLLQNGLRNVLTPYCEMYHYESQSRGYEDTPEKQQRLAKESEAFRLKWQQFIDMGDPFYSPHLSLDHTNFTIRQK